MCPSICLTHHNFSRPFYTARNVYICRTVRGLNCHRVHILEKEFSLINDFKGKQIPGPYVIEVKVWAEKKLEEFQSVLEASDSQIV